MPKSKTPVKDALIAFVISRMEKSDVETFRDAIGNAVVEYIHDEAREAGRYMRDMREEAMAAADYIQEHHVEKRREILRSVSDRQSDTSDHTIQHGGRDIPKGDVASDMLIYFGARLTILLEHDSKELNAGPEVLPRWVGVLSRLKKAQDIGD